MRSLVWFRGKDLRVSDHAPLSDAVSDGEVIPLFVLDPYFFAAERARELPHRVQFLLASLRALANNLEARGTRLLVVEGKSTEVVPRLARSLGVDRVLSHRWVEPLGRERDRRICESLDVPFVLYEGETLWPPGALRTAGGGPYAVFTPFARAFRKVVEVSRPLPAPRAIPALPRDVRVEEVTIPSCEDLGLTENPSLLEGGERAARERLKRFVRVGVQAYAEQRDRMDLPGTSRLSVDLKFGTLSPRQVWRAVIDGVGQGEGPSAYLNELVWREFAYSTLWDRPELLQAPFRADFAGFPWRDTRDEPAAWQAWVQGKTGYPVVDASARQLLREGFVHNRARMISASFLTKHLLIHYRHGEAHYMKYLTDGDWASNNAGWQWSAGCGCDAQPYFRVFNPFTQGAKFDPEGDYVRRWVPELAKLPARHIHQPWNAPPAVLEAAGVRLDDTYPKPIVDHRQSRQRFLSLASEHLKPKTPTPP